MHDLSAQEAETELGFSPNMSNIARACLQKIVKQPAIDFPDSLAAMTATMTWFLPWRHKIIPTTRQFDVILNALICKTNLNLLVTRRFDPGNLPIKKKICFYRRNESSEKLSHLSKDTEFVHLRD